MHEMSIAVELIAGLERLAVEHRIRRYEEVVVAAGALRGVVPEALDIAFACAAEGTPAEGARLVLETVPALAVCRACGHVFAPAVDDYLCDSCGVADVEIREGNDIILRSVTGDEEEENGDPSDENSSRQKRTESE
ncbi:MAG: hydrogenase maturation nickel metallochaperone HypA [Candidatus Eisenbacteria bacterium]|nr:hydrogenase maturation nickel metallochaperone HypA [Candidatus Eisenbacteria bacterium]